MKVLITEEQFYDIIPPNLKRRYSEINKFLDEVFAGKQFVEVEKRAKNNDKDVFIRLMVNLIITWFYGIKNESLYFSPITFLFGDKIGSYWDNINL